MVVVVTWRLIVGTLDKADNGETTFLLQFPVWWAYAASLAACVTAMITGVVCALLRWLELIDGTDLLPDPGLVPSPGSESVANSVSDEPATLR